MSGVIQLHGNGRQADLHVFPEVSGVCTQAEMLRQLALMAMEKPEDFEEVYVFVRDDVDPRWYFNTDDEVTMMHKLGTVMMGLFGFIRALDAEGNPENED